MTETKLKNFFENLHLDILNMSHGLFDHHNLGKYYKTKRGFWPPSIIMDVGTGVRRIWR